MTKDVTFYSNSVKYFCCKIVMVKIRLVIEDLIDSNKTVDTNRIKAIKRLNALLAQIDFMVESIVLDDTLKLINLFTELKGEKLTIEEKNLVDELSNGVFKK